MKLQPPGTPTGDPFFDAVRRRHRDVDIVLLPPDAPDPQPAPAGVVGDADLDLVLERVASAASGARDLLGVPDLLVEPHLGHGPHRGTVVARVRCAGRLDGGHRALAALQAGLQRDGWVVRRGSGDLERLVARRDDLNLRASYADPTGVLALHVTSDPLPVGADRVRELVRR